MILQKAYILAPLYKFILGIFASPPVYLMNFLLEPLGFSEIVNLWEIYGQKVIDTVFIVLEPLHIVYIEKSQLCWVFGQGIPMLINEGIL